MRSHECGIVEKSLIDHTVTVCGWVHRRRDHGGVIFIDLRDRTGLVQVVADPDEKEAFNTADAVRSEYVLKVRGRVRIRPEGTKNPDLPSGEVEIYAQTVEILNRAEPLPFQLDEDDVNEAVRLKHRYVDLRRPAMQHNLRLRHAVIREFRAYLDQRDFVDIETPVLTRSTPEGARDYLVPSRTHSGQQLLMVSGFERYYQIARCFRDEDLRADRQPEFTQLDIETSFLDERQITDNTEDMMRSVFSSVLDVDLVDPAPSAAFESMLATLRFGVRRPARVSRLRRLFITLGVSAFPAVGLFFAGVFLLISQSVRKNNPDLLDLSSVTIAIQYSKDDGDRENLRRFVAHRYRALVEDPETWNSFPSMFIVDPNRQRLAREAVADYPSLTPDEIVAAENAAASLLTKGPGDLSNLPDFMPLMFLFVAWIMYAAIPSLLMALIIRRGLILTMFGAVVVKGNGQRASRLRALWRGLIAWSPFLVGAFVAAGLVPLIGATAVTIVMPIAILTVTILSLLRRGRSLQDRLAGTWLVPK